MGRKAEVEQSRLFAPPPAQEGVALAAGEYDQLGFSIEAQAPREITVENCVVQSRPTVETVDKKKEIKEWRCGFGVPSDLWHQDRGELIEARTSTEETVDAMKRLRLKPGDMVTITGLITQQRLLVTEVSVTQLTHLNVTDIQVVLRAAKNPMFVKQR